MNPVTTTIVHKLYSHAERMLCFFLKSKAFTSLGPKEEEALKEKEKKPNKKTLT